jgi:hypothetical protein
MSKVRKSTLEKKKKRRDAGEWVPAFLSALRNSANVRLACQKAGIDRKTAYKLRDKSEPFKEQWKDALADACDVLEAEAWTRARGGSDLLLIFLLKAHRPEMYRETTRHELTGTDGKPITVREVQSVRRKRWQEIAPTLQRALTILPDGSENDLDDR